MDIYDYIFFYSAITKIQKIDIIYSIDLIDLGSITFSNIMTNLF